MDAITIAARAAQTAQIANAKPANVLDVKIEMK